MAKNVKTDRTVTMRMNDGDIKELDAFAESFGITRASAMRMLIKRNIKRYREEEACQQTKR